MMQAQNKWRDTLAQNTTGETMALLLKLESKIINGEAAHRKLARE
jgi:hypothetical protein